MEISNEEKEIINNLVKVKVKELSKFKKVRYGFNDELVTRVSFESLKIINDIDNYSYDFIITYLLCLKNSIIDNQIAIIDFLPNDIPNVTQDFINWIDKVVNTIKLEIIQNTNIEKTQNKHPAIFEDGAFDNFNKWIGLPHNERHDQKISFIFQKLKKENKLRNTTFSVLSKWAFDNEYLDKENYTKLKVNGCFISPTKILTKTRLDLYNSIIDL